MRTVFTHHRTSIALVVVVVCVGVVTAALADSVVRIGVGVSLKKEELEDSTAGNTVARHVFETLVRTGPAMEVLPSLARSWQIASDACTWRFELRDDVSFHDGTPFDADAVAFNFDAGRNPKLKVFKRRAGYLEPFAAVRAVASHTVEIRTHRPFAPMLRYLTLFGGWIESPRALARLTTASFTGLIGTGPFKFAGADRSSITLTANPCYYMGRPAIHRLEFATVRDECDRLLLLEVGRLDAVMGLPIFEMQRLRDEHSPIQVMSAPSLRVVALRLQAGRAPLDDARVRLAIDHGIDRQRILGTVLAGNGTEVGTMLSPLTFGYAPIANVPFDPARARALLASAGFTLPLRLSLRFRPGRYPMDLEVMEAVTAGLAQAGIELVAQMASGPASGSAAAAPGSGPETASNAADVTFTGWAPACGDGDWVLRPLFSSKSFPPTGANTGRYSNATVDRLIDAAVEATDPGHRRELYRQAQEQLAADRPYIYLYAAHQVIGLRPELTGVEILPQEYIMFTHARKTTASTATDGTAVREP